MAENRIKRDKETRETKSRKRAWQRPEVLPSPDPEPGYAHRSIQDWPGCRGRWLIKKRTRDVQQEQATFCK